MATNTGSKWGDGNDVQESDVNIVHQPDREKTSFHQEKKRQRDDESETEPAAKKQKLDPSSISIPEQKGDNNRNIKRDKSESVKLNTRFKEKVCLVMGGRGIGQSCALRFAEEGGIVYIADLKKAEQPIQGLNFIEINAINSEETKKVIEQIVDIHKKIDVILNGEMSVENEDEIDQFAEIMKNKVYWKVSVCELALSFMEKEQHGHIVNLVAHDANRGLAVTAAKGAVISLSKRWGQQYAKHGITVNSIILPIVSGINMNHEKLEGAIAFIASDENVFVSGACHDFSGGSITY